jgi:hypothetical protein
MHFSHACHIPYLFFVLRDFIAPVIFEQGEGEGKPRISSFFQLIHFLFLPDVDLSIPFSDRLILRFLKV